MPRVSICIPTHNRARLVPRAIDSALAQSEKDIEVILLDDASSDDTLEVAAAYIDARFRVEPSAARLGLAGNLNRSLEVARGTYVNVLCDDDYLYPTAIERFAGALDRFPQATFAGSAWNLVDAENRVLKTMRLLDSAAEDGTLVHLSQMVALSGLYRNRIGSTSNTLIRRAALADFRFDSAYPQMMDWDMWLRLLRRGPIVYVPQTLSAMWVSEHSSTAHNRLLAQSASDLLSMSAKFAQALPEFGGAVSPFHLKRLRVLCFLRATQIATENALRGDWQKVGKNLGVARRALHMLVV